MERNDIIQYLEGEALPRVARCIPAPVDELTIVHPCRFGVQSPQPRGLELRGTVYWGSLYICEVSVKSGTLVLHSWRPMYKDRGRLEYTLGGGDDGNDRI